MKTVVIRKYDNEAAAYIDADFLRQEGIDCQVIGSSVMTMLSGNYRLIVLEENEKDAKKLLQIEDE